MGEGHFGRSTASFADALAALLAQQPEDIPLTVEELEKRFPRSTRQEIVRALKDAETAGLGSFVVGRRNSPSRFYVDKQAIARTFAPADTAPASGPSIPLNHTLVLRRDPLVVVTLPADLNRSEADRLARWVQALPED